jgi:hypothetical protein
MLRFCNFHFTSNTVHPSTITDTFHVFETKMVDSQLVGKRGASQLRQHAELTKTVNNHAIVTLSNTDVTMGWLRQNTVR